MKPNKMSVAKRLKAIREDLKMSISMMADQIGTIKSNLNSYLGGKALPPDDIAENISKLSGVSKEWIYYGDVKEYMRDYLVSLGYEKYLSDFPETIDQMYIDFERMRSIHDIKEEYPNVYEIKNLFDDIYTPNFNDYVLELIKDYAEEMKKYPLYSESLQKNFDKYVSRVRTLIRFEKPHIKYGENDRILKIAKEEFNERIENYNGFQKNKVKEEFLYNIIKKLETFEGTVEFLSNVSEVYNYEFDIHEKSTVKMIKAFMKMNEELKKI